MVSYRTITGSIVLVLVIDFLYGFVTFSRLHGGGFLTVALLFQATGNYDLAMYFCHKEKPVEGPYHKDYPDHSELTTLIKYETIGEIFNSMDEYDNAIQVYEEEVLPRLYKRKGWKSENESKDYFLNLGRIYENTGDRENTLAYYRQALSTTMGATAEERLVIEQKMTRVESEMQRAKNQQPYIDIIVAIARRWQFRGRVAYVDGTEHPNTHCPPQPLVSRKDRFYRPKPLLIDLVSFAVCICLFVFVRRKMTISRFIIAAVVGFLILICLQLYKNTLPLLYFSKAVFMGWNYHLIPGMQEYSLELLDEARCVLLKTPLETQVAFSKAPLRMFVTAFFIYLSEDGKEANLIFDDIMKIIRAQIKHWEEEQLDLNEFFYFNNGLDAHYLRRGSRRTEEQVGEMKRRKKKLAEILGPVLPSGENDMHNSLVKWSS
jgi:tetratricopeptide (TPR) repeat protein